MVVLNRILTNGSPRSNPQPLWQMITPARNLVMTDLLEFSTPRADPCDLGSTSIRWDIDHEGGSSVSLRGGLPDRYGVSDRVSDVMQSIIDSGKRCAPVIQDTPP